MPDVLVIGGGIVGVSVAAQCARRDLAVTLVERGGLASGASGRNAGMVVVGDPPELRVLGERSVAEYLALHAATDGAFWLDREDHGNLVVAERAGDLAAHHGEGVLLDEAALYACEPRLGPGFAAGLLVPSRRIDPGSATAAWADEARRHGAEIRLGCAARALTLRGGRVVGALTDAGALAADVTVVAAGPWSWQPLRGLGLDLPVRAVRGWIAVTRPAPFRLGHIVDDVAWPPLPGPRTLADLAEGSAAPAGVAAGIVQDAAGRIVVGASLQAATGDRDESPETLALVAARALRVLPVLAGLEVVETRSCLRPMTPDGLPLHGPVPGLDGLVLACGHNAVGVSVGPGSGVAVAGGIAGEGWDAAFLPERLLG